MKLNISFPGLFILLSAVLQGHAIAIARLPATVRSSEIDLNKRQIFFKDYANEDQDEEAQNVERRQIFLNHYADGEQEEATQSIEKRQIFFKDYENEQQEDTPQDIGKRQIFLKHYEDDE